MGGEAAAEWPREEPKELRLPEPKEFRKLLASVRNCGWVDAEASARFIEFLAYTACRLWSCATSGRRRVPSHTPQGKEAAQRERGE